MRHSGPRAAAEVGPVGPNYSVKSEKALVARHTFILGTVWGNKKNHCQLFLDTTNYYIYPDFRNYNNKSTS